MSKSTVRRPASAGANIYMYHSTSSPAAGTETVAEVEQAISLKPSGRRKSACGADDGGQCPGIG